MIIGTFSYDKASDVYSGGIISLNIDYERLIIKPATPASDISPDYRVVYETPIGDIELGAAWRRTSDNNIDFVSVALDGPLLSKPVNAALFLDRDGTSASLVWNRVRPKRTAKDKISEALE